MGSGTGPVDSYVDSYAMLLIYASRKWHHNMGAYTLASVYFGIGPSAAL